MVLNLKGKCWADKYTKEALESISQAREHRRTMRRWSPSTAGMAERELVYVFGGCTVQNRGLIEV